MSDTETQAERKKQKGYEMSLSLNVLNHLGLNLYSNVPAVLSETVANAWDADAEHVNIQILPDREQIIISDDGNGMNQYDVNNRYLHVGYQRRRDEDRSNRTPEYNRPVMGRKGIGKLSLFSIANSVEIYTTKDGEEHAFRMNIAEIKQTISQESANSESTQPHSYTPTTLDEFPDDLDQGTKIVLTDLKKRVHTTESALQKRLSRRFGILGPKFNFNVQVNGTDIDITDRDYFHKIQFLWTFGNDEYASYCRDQKLKKHTHNSAVTQSGHEITGWIGTVEEPNDLVENYPGEETEADNLNKISLMIRGKMAKSDLLEDFNDGRVYTSYIVGEIHADFLDYDDQEDITTSSREDILRDDGRYQELLNFLREELDDIANQWDYLRNEQGSRKARESPVIDMWYESLSPDSREQAQKLFGKVNQMAISDEEDRRELFKYGVLAFEDLKYKENLEQLEAVSTCNIGEISRILNELEDLDATRSHQTATQRIQIIERLQEQLEEDQLEIVLQRHIGEHPWLLNPSWGRAVRTDWMEEWIHADCYEECDDKTEQLNIICLELVGKYIIIDLKQPECRVGLSKLQSQVADYQESFETLLQNQELANDDIEIVFIVGHMSDHNDNDSHQSQPTINFENGKVLQYDRVLEESHESYQAYINNRSGSGRISQLVNKIETGDIFE